MLQQRGKGQTAIDVIFNKWNTNKMNEKDTTIKVAINTKHWSILYAIQYSESLTPDSLFKSSALTGTMETKGLELAG